MTGRYKLCSPKESQIIEPSAPPHPPPFLSSPHPSSLIPLPGEIPVYHACCDNKLMTGQNELGSPDEPDGMVPPHVAYRLWGVVGDISMRFGHNGVAC